MPAFVAEGVQLGHVPTEHSARLQAKFAKWMQGVTWVLPARAAYARESFKNKKERERERARLGRFVCVVL